MDNTSTNKKVVVSLAVDSKDAINRIVEAKKEIDNLKNANKELEQQGKKNTAEYVSNQEAIKSLNAVIRANSKEVQAQIDQYKNTAGSVNQLRAQLKELTAQYNSLSEADRNSEAGQKLLETLKNTNDKLIEAETAWGNYTRLVGTYEKALATIAPTTSKVASGFNLLSGGTGKFTVALKAAGQGAKALGVQMLKLLANPFVAAFTAIVAVVAKLSNEFKKNDAAMTALQSLFAAFKPILDVINKGFQALVGLVTKGVEGISKVVQGVMSLIPGLKEYSKAEEDVVRSTDALEDADRKYAENHAKREQQISDLTNKSVQKDKYSYTERKKFVEEAIKLEKADLKEKKKNAQERLRIAEKEAALSMGATELTKEVYESLSDEMKNNITELRVAVTEAETEYNEGTRRLQSKMSNFTESEKKEAAERAKAAAVARKERLEKERELLDQLETATIEAMDESWEKQKLQIQKQYNDEINTLKRKLKEETNLTKAAREAINQLIELKEKELNKKLILANAQYWGEVRVNMQNAMKDALNFNVDSLSNESLKKFFNTTQNSIDEIYKQSDELRAKLSKSFDQTLEKYVEQYDSVRKYVEEHPTNISNFNFDFKGFGPAFNELSKLALEYQKVFTQTQLNIRTVIDKEAEQYAKALREKVLNAISSGSIDAFRAIVENNADLSSIFNLDNIGESFLLAVSRIDEMIAQTTQRINSLSKLPKDNKLGLDVDAAIQSSQAYLDNLYKIKDVVDGVTDSNTNDLDIRQQIALVNDGTKKGELAVLKIKRDQLVTDRDRLKAQADYLKSIRSTVEAREKEYKIIDKEVTTELSILNSKKSSLQMQLELTVDEESRNAVEEEIMKLEEEIQQLINKSKEAREALVATGFTSVSQLDAEIKQLETSVIEANNKVTESNKEVDKSTKEVATEQVNTWIDTANAIGSAVSNVAGTMQGLFQQLAESDEKYNDYATAMAMTQILVSTAISIASAIQGAVEAAAALGPGAPIATPAFIAEMVSLVVGALASATSTLLQAKQSKPSAPKFATGGLIDRGESGVDKVSIMATKGEYVINKKKVDELGVDFLDWLNFGSLKHADMKTHYAQGGFVNAPSNSTLNDTMRQQEMLDAMKEVMSEIQPVVSVKEITRMQNRVKAKQQ